MVGEQQEIVGVLLAAGSGSRFGGDKLLHPLADGTPLGVAAARNMLAAGLPIVAVVKPGDELLGDLLQKEGCAVTVCAHAARGMGASLAHGVRAAQSAAGWVIALADMPLIRSATIKAIADALAADRELVAPAYRGQRGHPVGFGSRFRAQLLALDGDAGAREIIVVNRDNLVLIECDDAGVLRDIDRREDLNDA
jgi:molybdenum cofactor cytidylyltransferase